MNAFYLTYAILALLYLLLRKKWDTQWLREGNYLFLALVTTLMFITNSFDFGMAYFMGYFDEMMGFYVEKLGIGYMAQWIGFILLPALGMVNYFGLVRRSQKVQIVLWLLICSILLFHGYKQESLDVFLPFYPIETTVEPGWYTVLPSALSLIEFLIVLLLGICITYLLGWFLKRKHERKNYATAHPHNALNGTA